MAANSAEIQQRLLKSTGWPCSSQIERITIQNMISPRSILVMAIVDSFWVFITLIPVFVNGLSSAVDVRDMSFDEYVNYVNPPAVHKFENEHGDSILCVKHSDQISVNPHRKHGHSNNSSEQRWMDYKSTHLKQNIKSVCPPDTVPIIEIKRENVERAGSVTMFISKRRRNRRGVLDDGTQGNNFAMVQFNPDEQDRPVWGASGMFNVWQPLVDSVGQPYSLCQIWVINQIGGPEETVEAGWIVYPSKFGDNKTRLFTYWTNDGYQNAGCFNQDCPGFVVAEGAKFYPGLVLPASIYSGSQTEDLITIQREVRPVEGVVWALYVQQQEVGYWPSSLFSRLHNTATRVDVGGEVCTLAQDPGTKFTLTDMGSGHFSEDGYAAAAYVRAIKVFGNEGQIDNPPKALFVSKPSCYNMRYRINHDDPTWGQHIFYGGPGGYIDICVN